MKFQEMLQQERAEGRAEGLKEGGANMLFQLVEKGLVTEETASEQLGITIVEFKERMNNCNQES